MADDNADRLTSRTFPNGVSTTYEYDGMSRLKRLKDVSSTATLFDRQYGYNNASQINQIAEPTQTRSFGYDLVNRLTSVTNSNGANESYNFDDVGNRTSSHKSSTYNYQPFNKVVSTATPNYNYDANGNMVSKGEGVNFWRYGYDYENRLVNASTRKQTIRYRYDALGRRVQRYTVGTKENTKFIYDGQDVLVDDNSGTRTKYLNGQGIDNKLRVQTGSDVNYFLADHLGSTNGLADASGNLTASTNYDAFGNATNVNFPTRYQFTGREHDNFTGLHYYRARWYDANLGRFISEDPIGFAGGDVNLFAYVQNNSLNFTDPKGLERYSSSNYKKMFENQRRNNPALNLPPYQGCKCPQNDPDLQRMQRIVEDTTDELNRTGNRFPYIFPGSGWVNNLFSTLGFGYEGCRFQAAYLQTKLEAEKKNYQDNSLKFSEDTHPIPFHYWVRGESDDTNKPIYFLDSWKNETSCGCRR